MLVVYAFGILYKINKATFPHKHRLVIAGVCVFAGKQYMQPQLLEFNFGPDNTRLLRYYPGFLNDVFSTLFLEDLEGREVVPLA